MKRILTTTIKAAIVAAAAMLVGPATAFADEAPPETFEVCVDTFEMDQPESCTVDECSTGVINELEGCEPVGTTAVFSVINAPAIPPTTVHQDDGCFYDGAWYDEFVTDDYSPGSTRFGLSPCRPSTMADTTIAEVATGPALVTLPETGASSWAVAILAAVILAAGASLTWAARR